MKRVHIHIIVDNIDKSLRFYNELFAEQPSLVQNDYVRWELTNPAMNFAISDHGQPGIDHLGIQSEDDHQLDTMIERYNSNESEFNQVDHPEETSCCYARSTKSWLSDPQGIQWELFTTHHNEEVFFGEQSSSSCYSESSSCC